LPASALANDPCCRLIDLDEDDRITLADLSAILRVLMGP